MAVAAPGYMYSPPKKEMRLMSTPPLTRAYMLMKLAKLCFEVRLYIPTGLPNQVEVAKTVQDRQAPSRTPQALRNLYIIIIEQLFSSESGTASVALPTPL